MTQHSLPVGEYTLKNCSTGTVLDLWYGNPDENIAINGFQSHGGENQKWRLEWTGQGTRMTLRNVKSGSYVSFKNFQNGVKITGSKTPQPFNITVADKGFVIESADHRGYVLDIKESNPANETPVLLYNYNATDNQKWHFTS